MTKTPEKVKIDPAMIRLFLAEIGRRGGRSKSESKSAAARENGKLGGWPKGRPRKKRAG